MGFTQTMLSDEFAIPIRLNFSDIKGYNEDIPNKAEWAKNRFLNALKMKDYLMVNIVFK